MPCRCAELTAAAACGSYGVASPTREMTPTHQKKLRADSKFALLTEEQRGELADLMLSGQATQRDALDWLAGHGVTVSAQSLSEYYRNRVLPLRYERMIAAAATLNKLRSAEVASATHEAVAQRAFQLATEQEMDPKLLATFYTLMLQGQQSDREERKLRLAEERARKADEAEAAAKDSTLTPEQKAERIKAIFGLN